MSGTVALTYDDGPSRVWTPRLLAALRRAGSRATFFVQARRAAEYPELVTAMLEEGHEVGFHCLDHVRHSERSWGALSADLQLGIEILAALGAEPLAWRAPWGIETDATRTLAGRHGLRLWGWNVDTHDWRGDSAGQMFDALGAQGGLLEGDVILMHDGLGPGARRDDCAQTITLTEMLLESAEERGLETASVSAAEGVLA
jgi:peptidoglycan-N-acetylglucosamine deacetylase